MTSTVARLVSVKDFLLRRDPPRLLGNQVTFPDGAITITKLRCAFCFNVLPDVHWGPMQSWPPHPIFCADLDNGCAYASCDSCLDAEQNHQIFCQYQCWPPNESKQAWTAFPHDGSVASLATELAQNLHVWWGKLMNKHCCYLRCTNVYSKSLFLPQGIGCLSALSV